VIARLMAASLALLLLMAAAPVPQPSGEEVMKRVNARPLGKDAEMNVRLLLTDPRRGSYSKTISARRRALPDGNRTLYRVNTPQSEQGIILLVGEDRALDGLWMYFPSSDHLLRVASRGLSALGSDFSCEDLKLAFPLQDYSFRILGRADCKGKSCLQVEMSPRETRLQREFGFGRAVGWVREDIWMIVRSDYYDTDGNLFKVFQVDELKQIQGIWTATKTSMVNLRADHRTDVELSDVRYFRDLSKETLAPDTLAAASRGARPRQ
jgi:hypothetical protein